MKKLFLIVALIATVSAIAISFNRNSKENELSITELANIEAIANAETPGGFYVICYCKTNWFSPNVCSANADGSFCGGDPCIDHDSNCR
ncbi:MAG: hypothetical protein K2K22_09905 [Muribaculaceae bacterium]|nr:hypothetical protein [Muribaculaceae bacterium]MDE6612858.1 hypothetical protein [Muribaculaceae bacterium]